MRTIKHYWLWIFLSLTILLGNVWQFFPLGDAKKRLNTLPLAGPAFSGQNVALSPFEERVFNKANLIKRVYKIQGNYFFLTVIDGTHDRHVVHDPYYCFRGGGWTILKKIIYPLQQGNARLIEISKEGQKKEALFWFSDGSSHYASPLRYWWQATLRRLTLGLSGEEPILIMLQPMGDEHVHWKEVLEVFTPVLKV